MPPSDEPDHSFDDAASFRSIGGFRIGSVNASIPFAELRADRDWVRIDLRSAARRLGPYASAPVWIPRSAVTSVRSFKVLLGRGLMFDTLDDRYAGVIFWCTNTDEVRAGLTWAGWPVAPDR